MRTNETLFNTNNTDSATSAENIFFEHLIQFYKQVKTDRKNMQIVPTGIFIYSRTTMMYLFFRAVITWGWCC